MKNTVHNNATSGNLKGKPMTKTIGLHCLQQVIKHVPTTDESSVHRAQLRVKTLYCHLDDCRTGNLSKCHDVITGTVTWPITVPVMIQSVTMALPVQ